MTSITTPYSEVDFIRLPHPLEADTGLCAPTTEWDLFVLRRIFYLLDALRLLHQRGAGRDQLRVQGAFDSRDVQVSRLVVEFCLDLRPVLYEVFRPSTTGGLGSNKGGCS
jgi:hypothetical protein